MLGIAERTITVEFAQNHEEIKGLNPFDNKVNSIGGWIQSKRISKNPTLGHLAAKMGIAAIVVYSWENAPQPFDDPA